MPKNAVAAVLIAAVIGAILFLYFTFPRTVAQMPRSPAPRLFPPPPKPDPSPVVPPERGTLAPPKSPVLRVMAWVDPGEGAALVERGDRFQAQTGRPVSVTLVQGEGTYNSELRQALDGPSPPDVCLVQSRDFCGLNPLQDLAPVALSPPAPEPGRNALTANGRLRAVPSAFSVTLLYYNPAFFAAAGLADPGPHWTWDILESITRALTSLHLKNGAGAPVYALELGVDFDLWNLLCTQAGYPALDASQWHLGEARAQAAHVEALRVLEDLTHRLAVTAPPSSGKGPAGHWFGQQQAALLIAPSHLAARLPAFAYARTLVPGDRVRSGLARVEGWGVAARSAQPLAAGQLAQFLAAQPLHRGWISVYEKGTPTADEALCRQAFGQALLPRVEPRAQALPRFLDEQLASFARTPQASGPAFYTQIQAEYRDAFSAPAVEGILPVAAKKAGRPFKAE